MATPPLSLSLSSIKQQLLKRMHRFALARRDPSFVYRMACRLTESMHHSQWNLDAHLVPFCSREQISDLLSRWSIHRLEHIDRSSAFYQKLIRYQSSLVVDLIRADLVEKKRRHEKISDYFRGQNDQLMISLSRKQTKAMCILIIDYVQRVDRHQRALPAFIYSNQKRYFQQAPTEMIELLTILGSDVPGQINYNHSWIDRSMTVDSFSFPRSFTVEHYLRLFFALYETCRWSSNHFASLLRYMLTDGRQQRRHLFEVCKRHTWFIELVVGQRLGQDLVLKKLLDEADATLLALLLGYPQLTGPLSAHLLRQYEQTTIVDAAQRFDLLCYQPMSKELFEQLCSLFKQTSSDVHRRQQNYPRLLQCASLTNDEEVHRVLQWIEQRLTNEQLIVIEHFLRSFNELDPRFQLNILPKHIHSLERVMDLAMQHLQRTNNTVQIIFDVSLHLLHCIESHSHDKDQQAIQVFACRWIQRCLAVRETTIYVDQSSLRGYPRCQRLLVDILLVDVFPILVSKGQLSQLNIWLNSSLHEAWRLPQIDAFLHSLFHIDLRTSKKIQLSFQLNEHLPLLLLFLKARSSRCERLGQLMDQIDEGLFFVGDLQRMIVRCQSHRQWIDALLANDTCVTMDQVNEEKRLLSHAFDETIKNKKSPGLDLDVLLSSSSQLTGQQQKHVVKIILDDYLRVRVCPTSRDDEETRDGHSV